MAKSSKLQVVGAVIETTQNTAATFIPGSYFLAEKADVNPVPEFLKREYKHMTLSQLASILGKLYVSVDLKFAVKGTATAATPYAPHSALWAAAGFLPTAGVFAFGSATITNFLGRGKSCTIEVYEAGPDPVKHQIKGCVATSAKLVASAGGFLFFEAKYFGLYIAPTDAAFPTVAYAESVKEPIFQSSTLSVHSYSAIVTDIEIDFGLKTEILEDGGSPYGILGFAILGRDVIGSFNAQAVNIATHDFFGKMLSREEAALSFNINGAAAGNQFGFSLPKTQYNDVAWTDKGLIKMFKTPFQANGNTGDDELVCTLT